MFLMWLGEQITQRGIGNGTSLIIMSGIVAQLPSAIAGTLELGRQGALSTGLILIVLVMAVAVITFIVFMERAQRRLLIQYPKRQVGNRMFEGQSSHLPLKLNTSGVIPPIFASSLLLLPTTHRQFHGRAGAGLAHRSSPPSSPMGGRCSWCSMWPDRVLRLLLHGDRVQPDRDRRQPEEAWRLHPRHPAGRTHCRIYRLCAVADHGDRRRLSGDRLPVPRDADLVCGACRSISAAPRC